MDAEESNGPVDEVKGERKALDMAQEARRNQRRGAARIREARKEVCLIYI